MTVCKPRYHCAFNDLIIITNIITTVLIITTAADTNIFVTPVINVIVVTAMITLCLIMVKFPSHYHCHYYLHYHYYCVIIVEVDVFLNFTLRERKREGERQTDRIRIEHGGTIYQSFPQLIMIHEQTRHTPQKKIIKQNSVDKMTSFPPANPEGHRDYWAMINDLILIWC